MTLDVGKGDFWVVLIALLLIFMGLLFIAGLDYESHPMEETPDCVPVCLPKRVAYYRGGACYCKDDSGVTIQNTESSG